MYAETKARIACAAVVALTLVALGGPVQRSPDGIEMIAMVRGWFSDTPSGVSPWYWPPLWPILAVGLGLGRWAEPAGLVLNVGCAAGTAFFLYGLARRASGMAAPTDIATPAALAPVLVTLAYGVLPAIRDQVATLDARALGSFLLVAAAESTLVARAASAAGGRPATVPAGGSAPSSLGGNAPPPRPALVGVSSAKYWILAGSFAFLAPLARPEGVLAAAGVAVVAGFDAVQVAKRRRSTGMLGEGGGPVGDLAEVPGDPSRPAGTGGLTADPRVWAVTLAVLGVGAGVALGSGRAWETLALPWIGVWPTGDILALYGFASAPTPYREWVLASGMEVGGVTLSTWGAFVAACWEVVDTHAAAMSWVFVAAGVLGVAVLSRAHPAISLVIAMPVVLLALSPQRSGQLSAVANVAGFIPLWLALSAALLGRLPRLLVPVVVVGGVATAWAASVKVPKTEFVEGSALTGAAAEWLAANVTPETTVYCSFSSRAAVRDAGLLPTATPSPFEDWVPADGALLVLSSVDARGNDAGRTLDVADDPSWKLVELLAGSGQAGGTGHWYAFLRRESP